MKCGQKNQTITLKDYYFSLSSSSIRAQHCFAADAAGAAPEPGAILGRGGAPSLVPVGGGCQRRR